MLRAQDLHVEIGSRTILASASFTVAPGDKIGLVGRNGAGKTTLMRVLAGEGQSSGGSLSITGRLGYFAQTFREAAGADEVDALGRILEARELRSLESAMAELHRAMADEASTDVIQRYVDAEETYRDRGGYRSLTEILPITEGLGIREETLLTPLHRLSGGERRRVELAAILYGGTDLLLLDEPTNHLDVDAKAWVMDFLQDHPGGLLVISHDLDLLDEAITEVLHLEDEVLHSYPGTYSNYRRARAEKEERSRRAAAREQAEIDRLADLADAMRHQSVKRARAAKSIDKRVTRMEERRTVATKVERETNYRLPAPPRSGRLVLGLDSVTASIRPGAPLFEDLTTDVVAGERILVLGPNGAGKTTLLRSIAGILPLLAGRVQLGTNVSMGYYAQEHETIDWDESVLDNVRNVLGSDAGRRQLLGAFGLRGEVAFQRAGTLSGGERTKLALARLFAGDHNLLLLDEPTNNLDPGSRDGIARALAGWSGTMLVVSHDTEFVDQLAPNRVLQLPGGRIYHWSEELLRKVAAGE